MDIQANENRLNNIKNNSNSNNNVFPGNSEIEKYKPLPIIKLAKKFIKLLKKHFLRPFFEEEFLFFISCSQPVLIWIILIFKYLPEVRKLYNDKILTFAPMNSEQDLSALKSVRDGSYILGVNTCQQSFFISLITKHSLEPNKPTIDVLRKFSIETDIIHQQKILTLIQKKKWISGPLIYQGDKKFAQV
jgi:hypothetical protein